MSQSGLHNFRKNVASAGARNVLCGRQLALLCSDIGSEPLTPDQARSIAADGGVIVRAGRRIGRRWIERRLGEPAVGVDCLKAIEEGMKAFEESEALAIKAWADEWLWGVDREDVEPDPLTSVYWAFVEAETATWREAEALWDAHECGGFERDALPVFLRRATPEEEAKDMAVRTLVAERRQEEIRMGWLASWMR